MIALDSNIYIYFLEKNPDFFVASESALKYALQDGPITVPTLVLMEISSGLSSSKQVKSFFDGPQFVLCDLTTEIALLAGSLRYNNDSLRSTDAIHLATALNSGASHFITNDEHLKNLKLDIEVSSLQKFM